MSTIQLLTLNVRGLNDKKKRQQVFHWLKQQDADIIALQETHLGKQSDEWKWTREWEGQSFWTVESSNCKGVALLINKKHRFDVSDVQKGQTGRSISLSVKFDDNDIRFVCVYAPNNDNERIAFFKSTLEEHFNAEHNVLLGDFNCTLRYHDRSNGGGSRKEKGRAELEGLMKRKQLFDVYSRRYPKSTEFTYFKPNSTVRSRIDFVMLDEMMDTWVQEVVTAAAVFSDHNAVKVKLTICEHEKGPGRWKMSKRVIESDLFNETFTEFWLEWSKRKGQFESKKMWWAETKDKIKDVTTWCACQIKKKERGDISRLEKLLLVESNRTVPSQGKIETLRSQLEQLNCVKSEGARIRAGVKWFEEGETSSAYVHNLEKRRMIQSGQVVKCQNERRCSSRRN